MALRICIPPTLRMARGSTTIMRSSQQSSATSELSRVSLVSTFLQGAPNRFLFSQQWRRHCRFHISAHRSAAHHYFVCFVKRCFHSALDTSIWFQCACCWCFLCTVRRAGCVGCYPHTARRDEPTWVPCHLPGRRVPNRKRMLLCYLFTERLTTFSGW